MTFKKLIIVDDAGIVPDVVDQLRQYTNELVQFETDPGTTEEIVARIGDGDGVVCTWRTKLTAEVLSRCSSVKFIALCASRFTDRSKCNIDLLYTDANNIVVSTLGQYGDEATAEYLLYMFLRAARNDGISWRDTAVELYGKQLGIVGLGHVGSHVAERAAALGMNIAYSGPHEKPLGKERGYQYLSLHELLSTSDIVTVHVPKGTQVMSDAEFQCLRPGVLLVNTSIGEVFDEKAFTHWLDAGTGSAMCDGDAATFVGELMKGRKNTWIGSVSAGDTAEMYERKSVQVTENIEAFLSGSPIRLA